MSSPIRLLLSAALLLSLTQPLHAQHTITGTVQDQQGAAVPFAVVELRSQQLGVQADDKGRFSLPLPTGFSSTDSLDVSALGYERQRAILPSAANCIFRLRPSPVALTDVIVRGSKAAPVVIGVAEVNEKFGYVQSDLSKEKNTGWQVAYFIAAPPTGYVDEVRFYVRKHGIGNCSAKLAQAPFRVRLYAADGPDGTPGTDLLTASEISSAHQAGWHTVNLSPFNIKAPAAGFFVAMEWLHTDDKYLCTYKSHQLDSKGITMHTAYGQSLAGATTIGHTYMLILGKGWRKATYADAAIQALIQP